MRAWGRISYRTIAPHDGDVLLPIPFHRQEHALSCEAASLKMALAYRGISVRESDVAEAIGVDSTPKSEQGGRVIWGDPEKGFVGDQDGRMFSTGYGVHWSPVSKAANRWRLAAVIQGWSAPQLAAQLQIGNPIIAWGFVGSGKPYEWQTPEGRVVRTVSREHVFVLNGFRGSAAAPEGFYLMDPIYGQRYQDTAEFMDNWSVLGQSGVVIY